MLAQLPAGRDRRGAGSVTLGGQHLGKSLGASDRIVAGLAQRRLAALLESLDLSGGEGGDGLRAVLLGDPAQRGG